jgi:hypothetical protein
MDTDGHSENQGQGGNTRPPARARRWCFTLNNYGKEEYERLKCWLDTKTQYSLGEEIGENGTPHLQGYFEVKNPVKFETLRRVNERWHLEAAKGDRDSNYRYTTKDGKYVTNITPKRSNVEQMHDRILSKYESVVWKPWQQAIIDIVEGEPDCRTIYWFWEREGNVGKTFLAKYLVLKYKAIIANGKTSDIFNLIRSELEEDRPPRDVIVDIPRSNLDYVNYGALEKLKDGCFYSGKYEGGMCVYEDINLICVANKMPEMGQMSLDRWKIIEIV